MDTTGHVFTQIKEEFDEDGYNIILRICRFSSNLDLQMVLIEQKLSRSHKYTTSTMNRMKVVLY